MDRELNNLSIDELYNKYDECNYIIQDDNTDDVVKDENKILIEKNKKNIR